MDFLNYLVRSDRILVGCMAVNVLAVTIGLRLYLEDWRDESLNKPVQPKTQYITQETEDDLGLGTLDTLLGHYNYAIRETASKIVCDRAVNDKDVIDRLLWGITRPDYDERIKNLRALAIVTDSQTLEKLHTWKTYSALVRSLELSLDPEQEVLNNGSWDDLPLRDMTEKLCLMFISQLVRSYGVEKLVKAKFVEKWLAKQNWGATAEERRRNFSEYCHRQSNRISDLVECVRETDCGRQALEDVGLWPIEIEEEEEGADEKTTLHVQRFDFVLPAELNDLSPGEWNTRSGEALLRNLQQSGFLPPGASSRDLRSRNREAMVLNDGSHPVNSSDIIQRGQADPGSSQ
ncbi:hypothetical protein QBC35DRAFT_451364 [Podospora australis]|uniref:Cytoskeleton-associated protein n=1 Tax=Podospora australis TaxID=1536484 RepID=A0AAN7AIE3_9PEZI|nr:hypothetical protein QBC35DRAFT_451364 [Podospora australis]